MTPKQRSHPTTSIAAGLDVGAPLSGAHGAAWALTIGASTMSTVLAMFRPEALS